MKKRDNNIDLIRGIAVIWIIFIHTCFWSGEIYVPTWLKSLSLIIDVPLFIFISGMTFNFSKSLLKTLKGLCNIWFKYLIFLIIYYTFIFFFEKNLFTLKNLIASLFFKFPNTKVLPVVNGSFWFIFMYFIVSILSNIIICIYNKYNRNLNNFKYILITSFLFYGISLYRQNFLFLNTEILMYNFIYLLGYYLYNYKIPKFRNYLFLMFINIIVLILLLFYNDLHFLDMQVAKSQFHINYLFYSFISIITITYLKDKIKLKKTPLHWVGKNAISFYFCQGIGSSLIYYLYKYIKNWHGIIKLPIMFTTNLIITIILVLILNILIKLITKVKPINLIVKKD